ncbi:hypothetical protein A6R70_00780 [Agrobacterium rubi]|nr:hypothetical protein [Agrobacterium rubi]
MHCLPFFDPQAVLRFVRRDATHFGEMEISIQEDVLWPLIRDQIYEIVTSVSPIAKVRDLVSDFVTASSSRMLLQRACRFARALVDREFQQSSGDPDILQHSVVEAT